ncbi:Rpn family recombination-promoting nuclease/putative transposase [Caldifermentibacillus hisashii]|uniref:Rpn family recombination-promoting nuclease/putative transposase n=1 Tax=Caldifermentibacillus hisashii TaxID=996558 RepID=UPI003CCDB980
MVIPLVIYHGKTSWSIPTSLGANLNGYEELPKDVRSMSRILTTSFMTYPVFLMKKLKAKYKPGFY